MTRGARRMRSDRRRKKLAQIVARDGRDCWICGNLVAEGHESIDHVERLADGGSNGVENLKLAHPRCNFRRDRAARAAAAQP